MKRTKILISIPVIVVAALAMGAVAAEKPATAKPAERSAELKVLDRLLGNWQSTMTSHKAKWTPKETRESATWSVVPVLGGRFIQSNGEWSDGSTSIILNTYDAQRKCYRMWWFDSRGTVAESQGRWDAKTKTMTSHGDGDNGVASVGKSRYPDDNTVKWSSVSIDRQGDIGHHVEGESKRVKQLPKRKATPAAKPADRSAEQKVLDLWVGDWQGTTVVYKAKWTPKETRGTLTWSFVHILGGRFIQSNEKASDGTTGLCLMTYDVRLKSYRMWYFNSQGVTGVTMECLGKWDAKTKTMTYRPARPDGIINPVAKVQFLDDNTIKWGWVIKDGKGDIGFRMDGKHTRVK